MKDFTLADVRHLEAAEGWIELENCAEAGAELDLITPALRDDPEVLKLRWFACATTKGPKAALEIADALVKAGPDEPVGWVLRTFALQTLGRNVEARDSMLHVVERCPFVPEAVYHMACCECRLGRLVEAARWLKKAFDVGDAEAMKLAALEDRDLKPLWRAIGEL